jgi:hypothetical protein
MKFRSFLSRHRFSINLLALAFAISALALPQTANAQKKVVCDSGCIEWNAQNGCTRYMSCCVAAPDDWACVEWSYANQ